MIPEFFARDPEQGPRNCSRAAGRIDFLHAPLFATHGDVRPAVPTLQRMYCTQHLQSNCCNCLPHLAANTPLTTCRSGAARRRPFAQQEVIVLAAASLRLNPALLLQALEAYVKQADPKRKLIILSYVGVWTKVQAHRLPLSSMDRIMHGGDLGWAPTHCCVAPAWGVLLAWRPALLWTAVTLWLPAQI